MQGQYFSGFTASLKLVSLTDGPSWLDKAMLDFNSMLRLSEAQHKQRQSVYNWFMGNKPVVRSESSCYMACLGHEDYVIPGMDQSEKAGMESLIDVVVRRLPAVAKQVRWLLPSWE